MDWYERLADYFPAHELKHPGQMEELLENHSAYHKLETDDYLVTYAEFKHFIFIDYLLVNPETRGQGIGSKILNAFKRRGKTVILEVEPPEDDDENTLRRVQFYERNDFKRADRIVYTRSDEDGQPYTMDVYYWSPEDVDERDIHHQMSHICREIHNFKSEKYYGRLIADPEEVLEWEQ
jgi:ribosomal protein S18 acetylase RimI-like enzyme